MKPRFPHRSAEVRGTPAGNPADRAKPITITEQACCCPARPVVTVVLPPTAKRPHTVDLLLCGHHYRLCRDGLAAAGAVVYGETGAPIQATADRYELSCPEPAGAPSRG